MIRLRTAAICICLDQDSNLEEDIAPFFATVEGRSPSGFKCSGKIDPHAYLYIEPTGNLAIDVEDVLNALVDSIDRGLLQPTVRRVDLQGAINLVDTWISTRDFYQWCKERGLETGEVCEKYDTCEFSIFDHAYHNANDLRKFYEAPFCVGEHADWRPARPFGSTISEDEYDQMLRENILLKMGLVPDRTVEQRPIQAKERNVLLAIIGVLCNEAKIDVGRHAKSAALIKSMSDLMGVTIGETTIEDKLKLVAEALAKRRT